MEFDDKAKLVALEAFAAQLETKSMPTVMQAMMMMLNIPMSKAAEVVVELMAVKGSNEKKANAALAKL